MMKNQLLNQSQFKKVMNLGVEDAEINEVGHNDHNKLNKDLNSKKINKFIIRTILTLSLETIR